MDLMSALSIINVYGGRGLVACFGKFKLGKCILNGGKTGKMTFDAIGAVLNAFSESSCALWQGSGRTYDSDQCGSDLGTISQKSNSAYWFALEALDQCFGGNEAMVPMEEELAPEEEDAEEYGEEEEY